MYSYHKIIFYILVPAFREAGRGCKDLFPVTTPPVMSGDMPYMGLAPKNRIYT
jgi:hypothetical protein